MALEEYRRKRDFSKTSEPPPQVGKSQKRGLSYLIQKHDATRLHYDFRLELNGVLLSWAVTRGPSLNPADKRLAVRTEDHPLSYGSFEGTIPKDQYGGGTVMLWDRGTWEPTGDPEAGLKKGRLSFELHGERLTGNWDLIRMRGDEKRDNWLLIKGKDQVASHDGASSKLLEMFASSVSTGRSMEEIASGKPVSKTKAPAATRKKTVNDAADEKDSPQASAALKQLRNRYPEVQLATLVDTVPEGDQWLHEIKFDGYRLLGFVAKGLVMLQTRNGNDWTSSFPSISAPLSKLSVRETVLDMEAVILDAQGKSSFQALQSALGDGGDPGKIVAYVFDLLHLDGEDVTALPLIDRKEKLQAILRKSKSDAVRFSEHVIGQGSELFSKACATGLEGIISKRADAAYKAGRQKLWLKIKCGQRQEFVIVGYSQARTGERAIGALYLGYQKDGELRYAGKAGTGFTMQSARDLAARFAKLAVEKPVLTRAETKGVGAGEWGSIRWVKPVLLCEVAFTEWTRDGRIRHPSFQGLREDKDASEVKQEKPVVLKTSTQMTELKKTSGDLIVAGVKITHADRVISEMGQVTKGELAEYYGNVAPLLLPQVARHPLSLLRCPSGVDSQCFYQRNPGRGLGADVHPFEFQNKGKRYEYLYIESEKGLLGVVQMGAIELHPWGASIDSIDYPDRLIFDLDPAPDVPFDALKFAAQDLKQRLQQKGLESLLKCTGGKGLHVTVPLAAKDQWPVVKSFATSLADEMVAAAPDAYVATMSKAKRTGKIFIDYFRNDYTATAIADYSVRAHPGAPVAVPLEWSELKTVRSADQFTMKDVLKRVKNKKLTRTSPVPQRIPEGSETRKHR